MIRDQVLHEGKMNFLQTKCFSCLSKDHISINCPLIHYVPDKIKIVKRHMKNPGQKHREPYNRKRQLKFNSLWSAGYVKKTDQRFRECYSDISYDMEDHEYMADLGELSPQSYNYQNEILVENKPKSPESDKNLKKNRNKSINPRFSQNFIKELNESGEQVENESIIIEKTQEENFSSAWNLQNLMNIPKMESEENQNRENSSIDQKAANNSNSMIEEVETELNNITLKSSFKKKSPKSKDQSPCCIGSSNKIPNKSSIPDNRKNSNINYNAVSLLQKPALKNENGNVEKPEINEEKELFNDLFQKEFEKGTNFKNFYPDFNLKKILEENRKKNKESRLRNSTVKRMKNPKLSPKIMTKAKNNKVVPDEGEFDKKHANSIRRASKKASNIFMKKLGTRFSVKKNLMSFYDVVNEVLYNSELRKKLNNQKKNVRKSIRKRKLFRA